MKKENIILDKSFNFALQIINILTAIVKTSQEKC